MSLPSQKETLDDDDSWKLFSETFSEIEVSGGNVADMLHDKLNLEDDGIWQPDKASEFSYCMVFPPDSETRDGNPFQKWTHRLMQYGMDLFCYKGRTGNLYVLIHCPLEVLRNFADDIDFKMLLDPVAIDKYCAVGSPEDDIAPIAIHTDTSVTPYDPNECIYAKYSKDIDESMYYVRPLERAKGATDPFTNQIRSRLVAIMINARPKYLEDDGNGKLRRPQAIKVQRRINKGEILAFYPLHRPNDIVKLRRAWLSWRVNPWSQPFHAIKEYFGEKVGLYFLFMGHYTRWLLVPAFVGLVIQFIVFSYSNVVAATNAPFLPLFSVFICIWAIMMLQYWGLLEKRTALEWGTAGYEKSQEDRPEFEGVEARSMINGEAITFYSEADRQLKIDVSAVTVFTMICAVVGVVSSIYIIRQTLVKQGMTVADAQTIASLLNAVFIQVTNILYSSAADGLTKWENYRTITEQEDSLTTKVFLFQFVNSYASFFYIAYFAEHFEDNGCGEQGCMYTLAINLGIIFITALVVGQITQVVIPFFTIYTAKKFENKTAEEIAQKANSGSEAEPETRPEHEFKLMPYDESDVLGDYTSTAIQFGYLALFVTALPMAAFLAFLLNLSEVKSDTLKMLLLHQRPLPVMVEDIGAFQGIFTVIAACAVISNGAIMKFTMTTLHPLSVDTQWWVFVGFQWVVFFILVVVAIAIPDESEALAIQKDRTEFLTSKIVDKIADDTIKSSVDTDLQNLTFEDYVDTGGLTIPDEDGYIDDLLRMIAHSGVNAEPTGSKSSTDKRPLSAGGNQLPKAPPKGSGLAPPAPIKK
jgi:anoctamin-10/anoctamin-7